MLKHLDDMTVHTDDDTCCDTLVEFQVLNCYKKMIFREDSTLVATDFSKFVQGSTTVIPISVTVIKGKARLGQSGIANFG